MGLLNDSTEGTPLLLEKGDILKKLEYKCWNQDTYSLIVSNQDFLSKKEITKKDISPIDRATTIDLKRAKIPVIVLSNKSIETSKLELFKRLNSGGSHLSPQEIRNALIYMTNIEKFSRIEKFSKMEKFRSIIRLDENGEKLSFDMEVITRYLILINSNKISAPKNKENAEDFYDRSIESILKDEEINIEEQLFFFEKLIEILYNSLDPEYGFRLFNNSKNTFKGSFSWFVFETIIYGANNNKEKLEENNPNFINNFVAKIKNLTLPGIQGKKTLDRMLKISKEKAMEEFNFDNGIK